jgi:hypothetical protein
MLDYITSHGFKVYLSGDMTVLEKDGMLADFGSIEEAYAFVAGIEAMDDA